MISVGSRCEQIADALELHGASVLPIPSLGDVLLVGYNGANFLIVVTAGPDAAPGDIEAPFLNQWAGAVHTAWDGDSALAVVRGRTPLAPGIGQTEQGLPTV